MGAGTDGGQWSGSIRNKEFVMKTRLIVMIFAATSLMARSEQMEMDGFPSPTTVYVALREINQEFLKGENGNDAWSGFARIAGSAAKYQLRASAETVQSVEQVIVSRFVMYSFACEYDDDPAKADFGSRLEAVQFFADFVAVRSDTNIVFKLSDWLGSATLLAADRDAECAEMAVAYKRDSLMIFGGKLPPRYPGSAGNMSHWGPTARQCREKYRFRRLYNERLPKFRVAALAAMRGAIMKGYENKTSEERVAIWEEFCRRAKATPDERKKAEE